MSTADQNDALIAALNARVEGISVQVAHSALPAKIRSLWDETQSNWRRVSAGPMNPAQVGKWEANVDRAFEMIQSAEQQARSKSRAGAMPHFQATMPDQVSPTYDTSSPIELYVDSTELSSAGAMPHFQATMPDQVAPTYNTSAPIELYVDSVELSSSGDDAQQSQPGDADAAAAAAKQDAIRAAREQAFRDGKPQDVDSPIPSAAKATEASNDQNIIGENEDGSPIYAPVGQPVKKASKKAVAKKPPVRVIEITQKPPDQTIAVSDKPPGPTLVPPLPGQKNQTLDDLKNAASKVPWWGWASAGVIAVAIFGGRRD